MGKSSQKCPFFYILDTKDCFLTKLFKIDQIPKNRHFPKGSMHDLCQKIEFFTIFLFLGKISQKRSLSDIQEAKDEFIPEK